MLRNVFARKRSETPETEKPSNSDEPIIHQSVPDEVMDLPKKAPPPEDTSWMDVKTKPLPEKAKSRPIPQKTPAKAPAPKPTLKVHDPRPPSGTPNPAAEARPKFPYGWLVVVEGAGTGDWFVLERGVSHIGSQDGQTVQLGVDDNDVEPVCHAELVYDENNHGFVIGAASRGKVRINGLESKLPQQIRDGDTISVGGTVMRLVGLCTPNFFWK